MFKPCFTHALMINMQLSQFPCLFISVLEWTLGYRATYWKTVIESMQNFSALQLTHSSVQSLSRVWLFATPWTTVHQASLFITNSQSPPKPMSIESMMPSNHLILCRPLFLLPSIFPSIRVFSNESALRIRWPKYWSFSFNISPSQDWSPLEWTGWISLQSKGLSRVFSNTTVQKPHFPTVPFFFPGRWYLSSFWPYLVWLAWERIGASSPQDPVPLTT